MQSLNIEYIFLKIYDFIFSAGKVAVEKPDISGFKIFVVTLLSIISVFFIAIIIYSVLRIRERKEEQDKKIKDMIFAEKEIEEDKGDKRWKTILDFITSNNPSDWRIAVIEADNMLDELTKELGLTGDNLGERLKNAPSGHFSTLDSAWEAHKVRNKIAHEGMNYQMEYREAKKAIEKYEEVFREFKYI